MKKKKAKLYMSKRVFLFFLHDLEVAFNTSSSAGRAANLLIPHAAGAGDSEISFADVS